MNRKLTTYIAIIGTLTLALLASAAVAATQLPTSQLESYAVAGLVLALACWVASRQQLYYSESNSIAMGTVPQLASIILLPFPLAMLVIGVGKSISEVSLLLQRKTRTWRAMVVNTGGIIIANAAAGAAFHALHGSDYLWSRDIHAVLAFPALIALAFLYHSLDVLVVVGAISLNSHDRPWPVFRSLFRDMLLPQVSLVFVGIVLAAFWHFSPVLSMVVAIPLALSMRSFEAAAKLREETVRAVLRLAESIDYRDTGTYEHSQRLATLTRRLAVSMGLIPEHVEEIVLAARVHDLGKIGISNEILLKPGPLTPEQRKTIEDHPQIGATILESYSAFRGSVDIVRHHHERWDGKGYPTGLKGEEIPLGSRIVSIVDAFDVMTADRPYRSGMSVSEAVERLKDAMGSQFDPRICAAFIQMLIDEGAYTPLETAPQLRLVRVDAS